MSYTDDSSATILLLVLGITLLFNLGCMKEKLDDKERALLRDTERFNATKGTSGWSVSNVIIDSMDLSDLRLDGASVEDVDWREMTVTDGLVRNSTFENVHFIEAEFTNTEFINVRFIDCTFQRGSFVGGQFVDTIFEGGKGQQVDFEDVAFEEGAFQRFDDQKSTFKESRLDSTRFAESNLFGTAFYNGTMEESAFTDSQIEDGTFHEVDLEEVHFADSEIENTGFAGVTGEVRFERCQSENGFGFGGGDSLDLRFERCDGLNFVTLSDGHFDTISVNRTTALDMSIYNASVNSLRVHDSEVQYLNLEADSISGAIQESTIAGLNFMDSKASNFSVKSVSLEKYVIVENAKFEKLSLRNVTYSTPFEVRGRDSATYIDSDSFGRR